MGIFGFLPVKEHFGKLWSLKLLVMVIAVVNLIMGLAYALTFANDVLAFPFDGKPRKCDIATEIQAYLFFQIVFIALYISIGLLLIVAFYITSRQICTDIAIILFIIQSALSFALLAQFILTKFSNESWQWSTCAFPNISYMLPFVSAIASNPFFIVYVNSFGEPIPGGDTSPSTDAAGPTTESSDPTESKPKKEKKAKEPKVYRKTETHTHK